MTARVWLFVVSAAGLAAVFLWGMAGLPAFGHYHGPYGDLINALVIKQRHVSEAVGAVNFDYRGVDTMGEETILFVAVAAVAVIMREQRDEEQRDREDAPHHRAREVSETVRTIGLALVAPTFLFGIYIVAHGHLTPGGGFQGGAVIAAGALLVYLAADYRTLRGMFPEPRTEPVEAIGMAGYVGIGLAGLIAGQQFLSNIVPLGQLGELNSGGILPLLNLTVGIEVAAGIIVVLAEYLEQMVAIQPQRSVIAR